MLQIVGYLVVKNIAHFAQFLKRNILHKESIYLCSPKTGITLHIYSLVRFVTLALLCNLTILESGRFNLVPNGDYISEASSFNLYLQFIISELNY